MTFQELILLSEKRSACSVSVETLHPAFCVRRSLQVGPEQKLHHSPFCRKKKLTESLQPQCSFNKQRSLEIARRGRVFSGYCPRGWWEIAFPFLFNGELAAVCYFGCEKMPEGAVMKKIHAAGRFMLEYLQLEFLLAGYENELGAKPEDIPLKDRVQLYLDRYYADGASLKDLADKLHCHAGYLGERIHAQFGKTFRQLLAERRVEESKVFLKLHREYTISRIASLCGFDDSNYFSTVFRKITGISPTSYRKQHVSDGVRIHDP